MYVNLLTFQEGIVLQTICGDKAVQDLCWAGESNITICHNFSKHLTIVNYTEDMYAKRRVYAACRKSLVCRGIVGLHQTPCLRSFLERLPRILLEQYSYEKVGRI